MPAHLAIFPGKPVKIDSWPGSVLTPNSGPSAVKVVIMRATDDRDAAISFLHGYFLGKKGETDLDTEKLAEATDKFIEYCLDNPSKGALAAMGGFVM